MLVPMKCPVCNGVHSLSYEKLLRCIKKQPKGQVEYVRYRVWWRGTDITVRPNDECWRKKFGLLPFQPRRFPMKQGWRYLCGLEDLSHSKFSRGDIVRIRDFDVIEGYIVFEIFSFDRWLKVSRGSFQWIEKYCVVSDDDDFTIWLCGCSNCKRTEDFEVCLNGQRVVVEYYGCWLALKFPVGELEAVVEWNPEDNHTNWEEEIKSNWKKFKKARYTSISVRPIFETSNFIRKVLIKHWYLGEIYVDSEGNVVLKWGC